MVAHTFYFRTRVMENGSDMAGKREQCKARGNRSSGTHTGQEPGVQSGYRDHGGVLLTGFFSIVCSACFLMKHKTMRCDSTHSWQGLPPSCTS